MRLGQLQEEMSKASLPISANLINDLNQLFWKLTKEKFHSSWGYFRRSSKNIYNLPKIMLHITPWIMTLMLHIRQSIYLVLTNVLSTSFLIFHITFDEISTNCTMKLYNVCIILVKVDVLDTCGAMCSYFGIAFLLFLWR